MGFNVESFISEKEKYYLYGMSNFAKWLCRLADERWGKESPIVGFIETKPASSEYESKPIICVNDIDMVDTKTKIIIASYTHKDSMITELIKRNIDIDRVVVVEETESLFRSLWEKRENGIGSICFWPPITMKGEKDSLLFSKIDWFFSSKTTAIIYGNTMKNAYPQKVIVHDISLKEEDFNRCDKIYLWDLDCYSDIEKYKDKVYVVDPFFYYTTEMGNYQFLQFYGLSEEEKAQQLNNSKSIYRRMKMTANHKNCANIICNGPSIQELDEIKNAKELLSSDFNIFVNASIKDSRLIDLIEPNCLVITDTIYLSMYDYCKSFYDALIKAWEKYKFFIVVFEYQKTILDSHFPQLKDYIIGMPLTYSDEKLIPSEKDFRVIAKYNVLTEMAIPIASSLVNKVGIFGCTGKQTSTNDGWGHSKKSNYSDTRASIDEMWPSLFRDYPWKNDYEMHCNTVEDVMKYGEEHNIKYYNRTTSYIPALNMRTKKL